MNTTEVKRHLLCAGCKHVVATSHKSPKHAKKQGMAEDWSMRSDIIINEEGEYVCPKCATEVWFDLSLVVPGGEV